MSGKQSRLLRNILSNWAGLAVQVLTALVLTPFILHTLGPTSYGIWILATGLIGYYGLLDLGFRSGLTQFMARYIAQGDYDKANRTGSTGFVVLGALAMALTLVGGLMALVAPRLFGLTGAEAHDAQIAIAVLSVGVATQFCFFTHSSVLTAIQRFDVSNFIGIGTRLLSVTAIYVTLNAGGGLVALSAVTAMTSIVDYTLRWYFAQRLLPQLRIRVGQASVASAREFIGYGLWNALTATGVRLISYTDALVIGVFLVPAAVTPFAVAVSLVSYFNELLASVGHVFHPHFTALDARGDTAGIRSHYLQATSLLTLGALLCGLAAGTLGPDFLRLWIGDSVLDGNPYGSAATILQVLLVGAVATGSQRIGYQVLLARGRPKLLAAVILSEALLNLVLSVALLKAVGLIGVAIGTAVPALAFAAFVHPRVLSKELDIPLATYVRAFHPGVTLPAALGALMLVAMASVGPASTWPSLFVRGILASLVCVGLMLVFWRRALVEGGLLPLPLSRLLGGGRARKDG